MRISNLQVLRANGGWRPFSFLKLSTDQGIVGWSEFVEGPWSQQLGQTILSIGANVFGEDPRQYRKLYTMLQRITSFAPGGLNHQAIAAIENACLDVSAKSLGIGVASLFGGPIRDSVELYWSHCGTFRIAYPDIFEKVLGRKRIEKIDDLQQLGQEALARGFRCVKINPAVISATERSRLVNPGFTREGLDFSRELSRPTRSAVLEQVAAMQDGLGEEVDLMIDLNFSSSVNSLKPLIRELDQQGLRWVELDLLSPAELSRIRGSSTTPIASLETLHGRKSYLSYLEAGSCDVAIVDVIWNGFSESARIADLAEIHEINVAPHNFYGPLADLISAQFCAVTPNLSIMEIEADDVPWKYDLLTVAPVHGNGTFEIPPGPGWGADVNEDAVHEHPWRQ